jgi:hypothetical protein
MRGLCYFRDWTPACAGEQDWGSAEDGGIPPLPAPGCAGVALSRKGERG